MNTRSTVTDAFARSTARKAYDATLEFRGELASLLSRVGVVEQKTATIARVGRCGLCGEPSRGRYCVGHSWAEGGRMTLTTRKVDLDEKEFVRDYCVSTVALTIEHFGGMWYETYIFPANGEEIIEWGELWGERYATHEEAAEGHKRTCDLLRRGELENYDGEKL